MVKGIVNVLRFIFFPSPEQVEATHAKLAPIIDKLLEKTRLTKLSPIINPKFTIYFFIGCFTTFINIGGFYLLWFLFRKPPDKSVLIQIINSIAWLLSVVACFLPNKFFVFRSPYLGVKLTFKEFVSFMLSRLATLIIEAIGLFIFCTTLGWNSLIVKPLLAVIVIILNYVFAKLWVFAKKSND
ncbi:MAG: GtrA family protein [Clostridia bacterium]|nr:GtrA family protein [Clostridia bacterium]